MAKRPIYTPISGAPFIKETYFEFQWYAGFSIAQKQRSIQALHSAAADAGIEPVLEISTKSPNSSGVALSAFNLQLTFNNGFQATVEQLFQSSKVFEKGGPYTDLRKLSGFDIKKDKRLKESGRLKYFQLGNMIWESEPKTAFYDWLYIHAVGQSEKLKNAIIDHKGFTDIEFNAQKSINCQAKSAALYVSLHNSGKLRQALAGKKAYLDLFSPTEEKIESKVEDNNFEIKQLDLFG